MQISLLVAWQDSVTLTTPAYLYEKENVSVGLLALELPQQHVLLDS